MKNRILELRRMLRLSQRQLAERVGTSASRIQRIEAGAQDIKLPLAEKICEALEMPLAKVFSVPELPRSRKPGKDSDEALREALANAGIDTDGSEWTLIIRLRGGPELAFPVSAPEKRRVWNALHDQDIERFVLFDSEGYRVALNRDEVMYAHFLFDPLIRREESKQDGAKVMLYFNDGSNSSLKSARR
ncbi:MAG: helix-turn-helix transcriptional regulator [Burkholderiales bacterium]